ncbi:MAG: exonuclease domain-containing protein [Planctomycetota bacterium]
MSRRAETILWHDYETTGGDPRVDRPLSFAACRTDLDLNEVEDPVEVHFRLAEDCIPSPDACLITGLDPDRAGTMAEVDGARRVLAALGEPRTCGAGYNSIRFDDEVTRFLLWRNLLPVYERESRNGSSRFDLLPVLRAACALRPDGMEWPVGEEGWPVFRLDVLAPANGIHHQAHDALADVRAPIAVAQKLLTAQPP